MDDLIATRQRLQRGLGSAADAFAPTLEAAPGTEHDDALLGAGLALEAALSAALRA